ncbi:MAG: hypothetical protein HC884_16850 [Chloroflexaceae bacterium]|nr:hypothetical protein [Chloroflexaceae bacterium]
MVHSPEHAAELGSVTRTFRASLRIGEDFFTLEESITLPLGASDDDIDEAVQLGWRVYQAQREACEQQIASIRETHRGPPVAVAVRNPDAPASDNQRGYIARLASDLGWSVEQLGTYASEQGVDMMTMNKGQASGFIDGLKRLAEERTVSYEVSAGRKGASSPPPLDDSPVRDAQYQALLRLAQGREADLNEETRQRFGLDASEISSRQAGELITEWQRHRTERNPGEA